jgi:hypothetical protein
VKRGKTCCVLAVACVVDKIDSVPIQALHENAPCGDQGAPNLKNEQADEAVMCASDAVTLSCHLERAPQQLVQYRVR